MTTPSGPQDVNRIHDHDDVDATDTSHHHTLGTSPTQAAPGNHSHGSSFKRAAGRQLVSIPANGTGTFDVSYVGFTLPIATVVPETSDPNQFTVSAIKITSSSVMRFYIKATNGLAINNAIAWTIQEATQ